jgi:hypothetical protein
MRSNQGWYHGRAKAYMTFVIGICWHHQHQSKFDLGALMHSYGAKVSANSASWVVHVA